MNAGIPRFPDAATQALTDAAIVRIEEREKGMESRLSDFFFPPDKRVESLVAVADRVAYSMSPGKMAEIRKDSEELLASGVADPLRILNTHGVFYFDGFVRIPTWFRIMPDGSQIGCSTLAIALNNVLATTAPGVFRTKNSLNGTPLHTAVDSVRFSKRTSFVVSADAETALLADIVVWQMPDFGESPSTWHAPVASLEFTVLDLGMLPVAHFPVTSVEVAAFAMH